MHPFRPRLLRDLRGYGFGALRADVLAGISVGVVAMPLAMAFAIASGLKPEAGLVTTVVAGFLISLLGGSRVQIGGPAGAFIVVVYGIVQTHGVLNLAISTVMAGALLFIMGLTRIGSLVRYIPVAIVIGFTNGIAILITLSQLRDFLGLRLVVLPADFFGQARAIAESLPSANPITVALAGACLALQAGWSRMRGRLEVPAPIVVLVLATAATYYFSLPVETIGSRFGGLPGGLPAFAAPEWSWAGAQALVGPVLTIALLGAIESLLCARIADAATRDRHDPNQELMAQGVANMVTPLFGGMPATGTIARTMTNVRAGARTPVAGLVHALSVLIFMLLAAPLAYHVPLAGLAAVLMHVAWRMADWEAFARLRRFSLQYRTVLLATFVLTVVVDLTVAVEIGLLLASVFFILRISSLTSVTALRMSPDGRALAPEVAAYRLQGSLFFGSVGKLDELAEEPAGAPPAAMVLDVQSIMNMDTTAVDALQSLREALASRGTTLMLCGAQSQPGSLMERSGFYEAVGRQNIHTDLGGALAHAAALTSRRSSGASP